MKRATLAVAVLALLASGGCSRKLLVGVVLPETGDAAVYGASIKTGVRLAFDQAFTTKQAPEGLEVQYRDSGSDPARAASAADALYDAGALVVIGGATSPEAKAMIPVADRWERVLVSPSASAPELARMSVYFFRVYPSDDFEGVKAADILAITRSVKTALIIQEDNAYARGLLPVFMGEFKNQGGRIVASVRIGDPNWQRDVRDALAAHQPQGVYVCGYGDAILQGLKVLHDAGYEGTICTTSAINVSTLLKRAGDLAEGVFLPLPSVDFTAQQEPMRSFVRAYHEAYSMLPDIYAAHGYDSALATLYATKNLRHLTGTEVQLRFRALQEQRGVTGLFAFDDFGNIKHYPRTHWIHDGKVEDYDAYLQGEKERIRRQMENLLLRGGGGA